ncbi:MAG: dephospho-CoA kinase [Alphaproteobacteria bacterium]|nr:dephospho-CoA kinase [Alphaproteobacteria bacterium]
MIVLGLTGSIGMGKTTIGNMMRTMNIPVHESDHVVHKLLQPESPARQAIAAAFPYYTYADMYNRKTKFIDRKKFGDFIFKNPEKRAKLEAIIHPLVREAQDEFIRAERLKGRKIVCLDIPLLFETDAEKRVDYTINTSAPHFVQKQRVLARPNMTEEKFNAILARQMPDAEKCHRADYVIKTGLGMAHSMKTLKEILLDIKAQQYPQDEEEAEHDTRDRA